MDSQQHLSSGQLLQMLELFDSSLKAKSVDEFVGTGLVSLAEIMGAAGAYIYLKETKHFPLRFFHQKLRTATAQSTADQAEGFLHKFSQDGGSQSNIFSIPSSSGENLRIHAYKLQNGCELLGAIGLALDGTNLSLPHETRGRMIDMVVQTIHRLMENEDIAHHLAHLRTYQTVCSMLKQKMDLHELLEMTLYTIMDVVSAEAASVLLLGSDKKHFSFYAMEGDAKPVISDKKFPADTGIAGSVLLSRQSEIINDVQNDPRFYREIDSETGFVTRNMIVLPLVAGEEPVGILEVINKEGGKMFTEKEHLLLCSIGEEIAFAIRNAKVFDYVVGTYCKQRQGQPSCKGCRRPLGSWTPCVKYQELEFKKAAVVEQTIYYDLHIKEAEHSTDQDRRHLNRKETKLPAFIGGTFGHDGEFGTGTVLDVSLKGIRFSVPKKTDMESDSIETSTELSIIFILTKEQLPIKATCQVKWVLDSGEVLQVGAAFVDPDSQISQTLLKFLI